MQRPIKFRVWDMTGEMRMLRVSQLSWEVHHDGIERMHFHGKLPDEMKEGSEVASGFGATDGSEDISSWILMQFTGLKDKNGTEIYEGDIVRNKGMGLVEYEIGEVVWCEIDTHGAHEPSPHCWNVVGYYMTTDGEENEWEETLEGYRTTGEVVGNIFMNPELIK